MKTFNWICTIIDGRKFEGNSSLSGRKFCRKKGNWKETLCSKSGSTAYGLSSNGLTDITQVFGETWTVEKICVIEGRKVVTSSRREGESDFMYLFVNTFLNVKLKFSMMSMFLTKVRRFVFTRLHRLSYKYE